MIPLLLLLGCPGSDDDTSALPEDPDGDGHVGAADCAEGDATVFVGQVETCNDVDDDCDGVVDPSWSQDAVTWFGDADGDGFGTTTVQETSCEAPEGHVDNADDCDDTVATVSPAGVELCNGLDDNCDGVVDPANAEDAGTWHPDTDEDGFGSAAASAQVCVAPAGFVADGNDCDDSDAAVHPDATEVCNAVDDDCDGTVDVGAGGTWWYADADGDGHGDPATGVEACEATKGSVSAGDDCDDDDPGVSPSAADVPEDGVDQDCYDGDLTCADVELRSAVGAVWSGTLETDDGDVGCGAGADLTFHWVAPEAGFWSFVADPASVAVLDGACTGTLLACGPSVPLEAGAEVLIQLDGNVEATLQIALE